MWNATCSAVLMAGSALALAILIGWTPGLFPSRTVRRCLALFALGQALAALLSIAIEAEIGSLQALQLGRTVIVATSLLALVECGRQILAPRFAALRYPWLDVCLLAIASLSMVGGSLAMIDRAAWLVLGIPGSLLVAGGMRATMLEQSRRVRQATGLGLMSLVLWTVAMTLAWPDLAALSASAMLASFWFMARWSERRARGRTFLLEKKSAVAFAVVVGVACWFASGKNHVEETYVSTNVASREVPAWERSTYQRWQAAMPVFAAMALLPAVGAGLYWLCAENRRTVKPRVR